MELQERLRGMRILVVDDIAVNVELLSRMLAQVGYVEVETATSAAAALQSCRRHLPDLLLLDIHMPVMTGYELLEALAPSIHSGQGPAVVVLTGDDTREARRRALAAGARDFIAKPFDHAEVLLRVRNHLESRHFQRALDEQNKRLESAVQTRTRELQASRVEVLDRLALVGEYRDDDTNRHARRIGRSALLLATSLELRAETLTLLEQAASLHDVGKIAIPDTVLRKPGRLTPAEVAVMQTHTSAGGRILGGSRSPILQLAQRIALTHHERWDGTGYPAGLADDDIPVEGRVVAVADVFDALTHERPYKPAWSATDAAEEIVAESGTHFDPAVVEAFRMHAPETLVDPLAAAA
ncbi:MAG: HD domain-containing phosphohydrolase [Thermoleophilia bacterium]